MRIALSILLVVVILLLLFGGRILEWVAEKYNEYIDKMEAFPTEGTYYCEELDIELAFSERYAEATIAQKDSMRIIRNYGARFYLEEDNTIPRMMGYYNWNQKKDIITLRFVWFPYDFDPDTRYVFVRQE